MIVSLAASQAAALDRGRRIVCPGQWDRSVAPATKRFYVMSLTRRTIKLLHTYRQLEAAKGKGPRFCIAVYALEKEMHIQAVPPTVLLNRFGVPDLWVGDSVDADWVYYFDHSRAGRRRSEWYFHFRGGRLVNSGFNIRGINDNTQYKASSEFVFHEA